jgi:hypothetical protein
LRKQERHGREQQIIIEGCEPATLPYEAMEEERAL